MTYQISTGKIDATTGFEVDEYGHLMDPATGTWFTDPYGDLEFVRGNGDDFFCFDYAIVDALNGTGKYLILHSVYNTETGSFIGDVEYVVMPVGSNALNTAMGDAFDGYEDVRHDAKGWNQDSGYFYRCVALDIARTIGIEVPRFSDRQKRFGGKRIERFIKAVASALSTI